jgi:hypothetical protein
MTLVDYLHEEIVFTEWQKVDTQLETRRGSIPLNYCLTAWTKLQGLELSWCYLFTDNRLQVACGPYPLQERVGVGDYIEVAPDQLSLPMPQEYVFNVYEEE